jgi:diguanylate cyclase (GGDEF)-like protein
MAQKYPEKYAPGELQKTRSNLGPLSFEESQRMMRLLGGEIGVERTEDKIEQKYQELKEETSSSAAYQRQRSGVERKRERTPPGAQKEEQEGETGAPSFTKKTREKPRFIDQVKMNILAARPEYQLKTRAEAIASIFSFLFPVRDTVHPRFIRNGDTIFYQHIEDLVVSIRNLVAFNKKSTSQRMKPSFYQDVINVLKDWNIETIHWELSRLQKHPRNVSVSRCTVLWRELYKPIVKLMLLDPYYHIELALKRLYRLDILTYPKGSNAEQNIREYYAVVKDELPYILEDLKRRCYPLLMKLCSDTFSPYDRFFDEKQPHILEFLGLAPEDLLLPPKNESEYRGGAQESEVQGSEEQESDEQEDGEQDRGEGEQEETEGEVAADEDEHEENGQTEEEAAEAGEGTLEEAAGETFPPEVKRGLQLLDQLFPYAGFDRIEQYPDFYAYFQPLFGYPRGTELISPEDPLLTVIVLISIIQELFFGFRSIHFGGVTDDQGRYRDVQELISENTDSWYLFIDELLSKHYASQLYEYCRQIERSVQFKASSYGQKMASDLMWIKRLYFFPYLSFTAVQGPRPSIGSHLPRLYEVTAQLKSILSRVVLNIDRRNEYSGDSVKNWNTKYWFEIENHVSRRLKYLLGQQVPLGFSDPSITKDSNAMLLLYTLSIITVLDYLINDPESFFYAQEEPPLYRTEPGETHMPCYSVELTDTEAVLRQVEQAQLGLQKEGSENDSGCGEYEQLREIVREHIETYHRTKEPFTLLQIDIAGFTEYNVKHGSEAGDLVLEQTAELVASKAHFFSGSACRGKEDDFFIILPGKVKKNGLSLAITLIDELYREQEIELDAAVVEFHKTWGPEKVLKIMERALTAAKTVHTSAVGLYETLDQEVILYDPFTWKQIDSM